MNSNKIFELLFTVFFIFVLVNLKPSAINDLQTAFSQQDPAFEKVVDGTSDHSYIKIVNKKQGLSKEYVPSDLVIPKITKQSSSIYLRSEASKNLEKMFEKAQQENISLILVSGYRSYERQKEIFERFVKRDGFISANQYSAKEGYSEHQTGLVADIDSEEVDCYLKSCFGESKAGKWLQENSYKFGFILRYPQGKEKITGYIYEPWHFRYVTKEEAAKLYRNNLVMEEYYPISIE